MLNIIPKVCLLWNNICKTHITLNKVLTTSILTSNYKLNNIRKFYKIKHIEFKEDDTITDKGFERLYKQRKTYNIDTIVQKSRFKKMDYDYLWHCVFNSSILSKLKRV